MITFHVPCHCQTCFLAEFGAPVVSVFSSTSFGFVTDCTDWFKAYEPIDEPKFVFQLADSSTLRVLVFSVRVLLVGTAAAVGRTAPLASLLCPTLGTLAAVPVICNCIGTAPPARSGDFRRFAGESVGPVRGSIATRDRCFSFVVTGLSSLIDSPSPSSNDGGVGQSDGE